jgi:hypothetical protein
MAAGWTQVNETMMVAGTWRKNVNADSHYFLAGREMRPRSARKVL